MDEVDVAGGHAGGGAVMNGLIVDLFAGGVGWVRGTVVALCNDGSLWELYSGKWERLPDIPQEEVSA